MVVIFQDIHKKIEKIKNNAPFFLTNQKYLLNFCFIKYLLYVNF